MPITLDGTNGITNDGGYTGDGVVFADTTPANTLVTTTGGNVGIGTSSPSVTQNTVGSTTYSGVGNGTALFQAVKTNTAADAGVLLGSINGNTPYVAATRLNGGAGAATPLTFYTDGTERARIDSGGNLLVGTVASFPGSGNTSVGLMYETSGTFFVSRASGIAANFNRNSDGTNVSLRRSGAEVGAINVTSSSTAYVTSSDYRLKENIAPMTGALAKVAALKPVTYKWKSDGSDGQGFIAHELQAVVPDAVVGEKDAVDAEGKPVYQGIDTSFLVATLTAAIQEQQAIITALTARVAALEGK